MYLLMIASAKGLTLFSGISHPMKKGRMRYLTHANVMIDPDELFTTSTDVQVYRNATSDPSISTQAFFFRKEYVSKKMAYSPPVLRTTIPSSK